MADTSATGNPTTPVPTVQSEASIANYAPLNPDGSKSYMPNDFFQFHQNKRYDADRNLYSDLLAEGFNMYGTPMMYYVVTYDTDYDVLFGEDNNKRIYRKFPVKAMYELPLEEDMYQQFGLEGLDNFEIHISKKHFIQASQYDTSGVALYPKQFNQGKTSAYDVYVPQEGDILRAEYNNTYYEVMYVHDEEQQFLQGKHAWKLRVRVFRDEHLSFTSATSGAMTDISAVSNIDDTTEINDYITSAFDDIKYTSGIGEATDNTNENDIGWF